MKVLITRSIPDQFVTRLRLCAEVEVYQETIKAMPKNALLTSARDKDIIITMLSDQIDKDFIDQNPQLKAIINLAVGYDNIDIEYAKAKGIMVCNTPDVLTETTAELGFTLMLTTARRIVEASELVKTGQWVGWSPYLLAGLDVFGKTVGIYGMGSIGVALARRCKGLNMHIQYHNRNESQYAQALGADYVSFEALLETSDFVVCTAPLTEETKGIFNKSAFDKMKSSAIFINIGRGGHVVDSDLLEAIQSASIYAAGVDVLNNEPVGKDHPFLSEKRITVLPHIGSASVDTRDAMVELCIKNAEHIIQGKAPVSEVK
ncbi:2-hydroxyacid dehydrogenase [Macrococcoides caseolyticum]|uniref:2-hydroxyacid dehydrogenase n=1 Tax=Macrococcoides caseolyticum TaxID=69966 RepID=UPI001F25741C|nr:D-glycerate dehydrogenase [Macrococcus caseolyticus]MCE4955789.1 D-glycerate dehydrogenase [Macrococcus caseolyticus]